MTQDSVDLPIEVEAEVGTLISSLRHAGWTISAASYDGECFGNWYADLFRASYTIRLVKDRSQYFALVPSEIAKSAGLSRAFENLDEFQHAIGEWAAGLRV